MVLQLSEAETNSFIKKVNFKKAGGLVPAIVQDTSNDNVLMQAFMNEEALKLTLTSGKMHFWSRSRGRLWLKGEESGHYSLMKNAVLDCDKDAILFKVQQIGPVCHTGEATCFNDPIIKEQENKLDARIVERIFEVILERIRNPTKESYVSNLTAKGEDAVLQKIGEETFELALAAKGNRSKEITHEVADLLFHILVLLAQKSFKLQGIFNEIERRHQVKTQKKGKIC